ncbi:ATP-binding protein [Mycobacterium colombiense]|uniref:ATP-binding protein n=1 Tax=Mycobacterium colombiense TaxID=339268 RepID=UPI0009BCB5B4|nr:ATP-binding protein [Mycobacterium colombiense]
MRDQQTWSPTTLAVPKAASRRPVFIEPDLVNAVGLNHSLPTALADLVDNSIDAHATRIRIRFLLADYQQPVGIQVIDNGDGMSRKLLDRAVIYSAKRKYEKTDLGHFGVGLKAASFTQAATVVIASRTRTGSAVGCVLERRSPNSAPTVGEIGSVEAEKRFDIAGGAVDASHGTLVEWQNPRNFLNGATAEDNSEWIEQSIRKIRFHLGLVFHRIISSEGGPEIGVDTIRTRSGHVGPVRSVDPVDPFGYQYSGDQNYPQEMVVTLPDGSEPVIMTTHVWQPKAQFPEYKLNGLSRERSQGFYIYRRNRLLQAGGWSSLLEPRPEWALARVSLDLCDTAEIHVTINPEKSGVQLSADLRSALNNAYSRVTGASFGDYLNIAAAIDRKSRARKATSVAAVEPRKGLPPSVLSAYAKNLSFRAGYRPVDIRWNKLANHKVFDINFELRILELNSTYRVLFVGQDHSGDANDAPVVKVLLHLLVEKFFAGQHIGPKDRMEIVAWNAILFAAVTAEAEQVERDRH